MKKIASLLFLVFSIFLIIGQGCDGGPAQPPEEKEFEPFSFAIITDLHVGRGISDSGTEDYGAKGVADYDLERGKALNGNMGNEGGFNYITDRLVATVNWINENYQRENIKFLVILGDISDTAEMSEFFRARKILDNLEIPYVPLIGNHDFWAYVGETSTFDRTPIGDFYFENIFWGKVPNKVNIDRIKQLFGESWQRQEEIEGFAGPLYYFQNYTFSYQGINFIALDYARRDWNLMASAAEPFPETKEWLRENLEEHKEEIVIVFSHHPYMIRGGFSPTEAGYLTEVVSENDNYVLNFGGHIHNYDNTNAVFGKDSKVPVIVTKGLMGREGDLQEREDADFLRIVKIKGPKIEDIDYDNIITILTGRTTFTPTVTPSTVCPPEGEPKFSPGQEVITTDSLKVRENPGFTAREIKTQPRGTSGKILEGPVCADNYIWWKVEYQDGTIGWSAEDWLETRVSIITSTVTPSSITEIKGKIAFVGEGAAPTIYTINTNGTELRKLRAGLSPSWSPNGSKIAFVDWTGRGIGIMNEDGSNLQWLKEDGSYYSRVSWSPDGNKLAFTREDRVLEGGPIELWVMNIDGGNETKLPIDSGVYSFSWSPDGKKIIFSTSEATISTWWWCEANSSIYLMDLDNYNQDKLADGCDPAWSPKGNKIAFVKEDRNRLYVMDIDTGEIILLKTLPFKVYDIVWSPDGNWLALGVNYTAYSHRIYFLGPDGQLIQLQTQTSSWAMHPSWLIPK